MTLELYKTGQLDRSLIQHGTSCSVICDRSWGPVWTQSLSQQGATALIAVVLAVVVCGQPATAEEQSSRCELRPKIIVLRGVFEVFSLGMNDLTRKLACRGYDVKVTSWALALHEINCADQQPYVIIGHSLGGRMCGWGSRKLMGCGKRIPLIVIVDANLLQPIPPNVEKCLNLYVTNPFGLFHGRPVRGESPCTEIINRDVSNGQLSWFDGGINHFNIDATPWVHQIIINEIANTFPPELATATSRESTREAELASAPSLGISPPAQGTIPPMPRTRRIPWSPFRPESSTPDRQSRPSMLAWRPDRPEAPSRSSAGSSR